MQVKLKVLRGSSAGKEIRIPGKKFRIGRAEGCQLRPKSDSVSRRHCEITIEGDQVFVKDLGSRNGTLINDEKIEPKVAAELTLGNVLRVGKLEFEVLIVHGLDAGKRAKVTDVKEAAARTKEVAAQSSDPAEDEDISTWLEDQDAEASESTETRQYEVGDTDRIALEKAKAEAEGEEGEGDEVDDESGSWFRRKNKEYGKLPDRPKTSTENSRDAAADMLKKYFNRT